MPVDIYKTVFDKYFSSKQFEIDFNSALEVLQKSERIFFIGNGGSNSICSHMMEDFAKIARFPTFSFSDASLITCFSNDYGYENAIAEWLKIHFKSTDLLVAISSSGNSKNILNAVDFANLTNGNLITLSGFENTNQLKTKGEVNFHIEVKNYGVVECFHQVILHMLLDKYAAQSR